ncbi:MAG: hypothetical protein M3Q27_13455 [Actinomycetota bacterium]|nr:hypothetical protein [Actinomycetota bacterium]
MAGRVRAAAQPAAQDAARPPVHGRHGGRKDQVKKRRNVEIVFNMDGFGGREAKLSKYRMLRRDKRFPLGMKLFLTQDINRMRPAEVLRLRLAPRVVEYQ